MSHNCLHFMSSIVTWSISRDPVISCDRDISIFTSSPFHRIRSFSGLHHQHSLIHLLSNKYLAKTLKVIWHWIFPPLSTHSPWRYWALEITASINRGPLLEWLCRCPACFWFLLLVIWLRILHIHAGCASEGLGIHYINTSTACSRLDHSL